MPYIESDTALPTHHKTKRAARALGCGRAKVVGCLHCLWAWAFINAPDGDLTRFGADTIADEADWDGDPKAFIAALINAGNEVDVDSEERLPGFLTRTAAGRLVIHDWWTQGGGKLIAIRERKAYRIWFGRRFKIDTPDTAATYDQWVKTARREHSKPVPYEFISLSGDAGEDDLAVSGEPSDNVSTHSDTVSKRVHIEQSRAEQRSVAKSKQSGEESVRGEPSGSSAAGLADAGEPSDLSDAESAEIAALVEASLAHGEPVSACLPASSPKGGSALPARNGTSPPEPAASPPPGVAASPIPDQGRSPQQFVEWHLLRRPPHWKAALDARVDAYRTKNGRIQHIWPFKAKIIAEWVRDAESAPPEPPPPKPLKPPPVPAMSNLSPEQQRLADEANEQVMATIRGLTGAERGSDTSGLSRAG